LWTWWVPIRKSKPFMVLANRANGAAIPDLRRPDFLRFGATGRSSESRRSLIAAW
jgi:hypothetical protein